MKKLLLTSVILVFALSIQANANADYSKRVGGYFYTSLSPYGTWIEIGFGTPVWRPTNIRRAWSPYSQGQWIYTDYGWYWDSYEPFGEIVYHYGRWYFDDYYGWIWIPDYEWAPAWVDWRYDDDYIGWAPLSPYALFTINIGIHYTYNYYVPYSHWNFVRYNNFCNYNIYSYYVAPKYKYRIFKKTKVRTNYTYYKGKVRNDGIGYDRIRDRSGRIIEKRKIVTYSTPLQNLKERDSNRNNDVIRTYIANRDDISRDGLKDVKIEIAERKSSLQISKVELGRDRTVDRTSDTRKVESREVNKTTRGNTNNDKGVKSEDTGKESRNNIKRNTVKEDRKIQERKDTKRKNTEIQKRNAEQIMNNVEIKRTERQKRNEVVTPKREEKKNVPKVNTQKPERKVKVRQETKRPEQRNQTINRNNKVKRNTTNNRTETKKDSRTADKTNSKRTR